MDKTRVISIQDLTVWLAVALLASAGLYLAKHNLIMSRSTPVFVGEESKLFAPAKTQAPARAAAPVKAQVMTEPMAAVEAPVQPATAAPLPIVPPAITFRVLPEYPAELLAQGLTGTTLLSIQIGLAGQAERVEVKSSSGIAEFDHAAVKAAELWRFTPASQGGTALASCYEVPVRFEVK